MTVRAFLAKLNRKDTPILPVFNRRAKYFLILFIALALAFSTVTVLAQDRNIFLEKQDAMIEGSNQEDWIEEAGLSQIASTITFMAGTIPEEVLTGKTTGYIPGGAIGTANNMVVALYKPQASGIEYIASLKDNLLGKPAYAQGTGFRGLQPILPLWRGFRNVVYLLSSLIFITVGIMIILRVKISPQAVISIQNAIPNIITTLLLVTFSYAIAGLFIDLTYVVQGIVISTVFMATGNPSNLFSLNLAQMGIDRLQQAFGGTGVYTLADLMQNNGFIQTFDLVTRLVPGNVFITIMGIIGAVVVAIGAVTGGAGVIIGGAGMMLVLLIFLIIIFFKLLTLLFGLVKAYINVLIKIIFAPLEIGLGAFPGSKTGFSTWAWQLVANLAVFPGVLLFLVIANLIVETIAKADQGSLWVPNLLGIASVPFSSFAGNEIIAGLVGIGAFMLVAKLPEMIPQVIFALKPSPWGTAIGEGLDYSKNPLYKVGRTTLYNRVGDSISTGRGTVGGEIKRYADSILGPGGSGNLGEAVKAAGKS